jgi:hypothetical protein
MCFCSDVKFLCYQDGYAPDISMKIGGDSLQTSTWSELIKVSFSLIIIFLSGHVCGLCFKIFKLSDSSSFNS